MTNHSQCGVHREASSQGIRSPFLPAMCRRGSRRGVRKVSSRRDIRRASSRQGVSREIPPMAMRRREVSSCQDVHREVSRPTIITMEEADLREVSSHQGVRRGSRRDVRSSRRMREDRHKRDIRQRIS